MIKSRRTFTGIYACLVLVIVLTASCLLPDMILNALWMCEHTGPHFGASVAHAEVVFKDRVKESTTTTGTGTLTLGGALTGYQSFSTVGNGKECFACVYAVNSDGIPTGQWEVFKGTYTASGSTLSRDTVLSSSTGSAVSLSAGTKHVVLSIPASEAGTIRTKTGDNAEFSLHSTKAGGGSLGGNVLRLQQHNGDYFSCVYCVGHDVAGEGEGYGAAFGWGNNNGQVFGGRAYVEAYNGTGETFVPLALIQTSVNGFFRRYEAEAGGDQVFYRRNAQWNGEAPQLKLENSGDVIVSPTALATDATNGFFRLPSCAGTPTGAATDGSMVRDSTNHKVYFRSGGSWIPLN